MFHKCTTQYIMYYSRNIDLHCICGLIVRLVYPLATSSTIPGSGSPCRSPTQLLVHLAPTDLVHRPAQQPGDHYVCSGPSTQAMAPLGHVESSKSLQTYGTASPAACVCPYVGRQPPILNLLPLRYLLTFINFVTPPPKGCSIASPLLPIIATSLQISTSCQFPTSDPSCLLVAGWLARCAAWRRLWKFY